MPLVSVIVLVWSNTENLADCLAALQSQTHPEVEVIVVDNGSHDPVKVREDCGRFPALSIQIERMETNIGYAAANNFGARLVRGRWLALLNDDAFPDPDWLEALIQAAEQNLDHAFFSSRQIQFRQPNFLDGAGDSYHITGLAWRRFFNRPVREFGLTAAEVFSACPAAALYDREELLKLGGFDEDYFSYFEDVDLGFRLRLNGVKCLYVPEAVVHHVGSASTGRRSNFSVYYGYRNMIWTFFKNMPSPYIWLFLPLHIFAVMFFAVYLTLRGQGGAIWRAIFDAARGLPKMLAKRRLIQNNIKVNPRELIGAMSIGLFEPFREFLKRNRPA